MEVYVRELEGFVEVVCAGELPEVVCLGVESEAEQLEELEAIDEGESDFAQSAAIEQLR